MVRLAAQLVSGFVSSMRCDATRTRCSAAREVAAQGKQSRFIGRVGFVSWNPDRLEVGERVLVAGMVGVDTGSALFERPARSAIAFVEEKQAGTMGTARGFVSLIGRGRWGRRPQYRDSPGRG